ncbi:MAG: hypothetical protein AAF600_16830 [Bacteroidota bacterium]
MKSIIALPIFLLHFHLHFQDGPMKVFENLMTSSWISEGEQLGGFDGKTVYQFEWGLNGKIIHVKTFTTDPKTRKFGLRNEGIRAFNHSTSNLEFFEFDKTGGITTGIIIVDGKSLHYEYEYQEKTFRDSWIYVSKDKYQLIVGTWADGRWAQRFHETMILRDN